MKVENFPFTCIYWKTKITGKLNMNFYVLRIISIVLLIRHRTAVIMLCDFNFILSTMIHTLSNFRKTTYQNGEIPHQNSTKVANWLQRKGNEPMFTNRKCNVSYLHLDKCWILKLFLNCNAVTDKLNYHKYWSRGRL